MIQCILYDEENMYVFDGEVVNIESDAQEIFTDNGIRFIKNNGYTAKFQVGERIELDPTTMKRIARFNLEAENKKLEAENKKLNEDIEERKRVIEKLKNDVGNMIARIDSAKQAVYDILGDDFENLCEDL